jgi:hypothetical protein
MVFDVFNDLKKSRGGGMDVFRAAVGIVLALTLMAFAGCEGLHYVKTTPEAKNFHPKSIGVLPVDVGINLEAKGTIDKIIADDLTRRRWFQKVLPSASIQDGLSKDAELGKAVTDYMSKLTTVNFSDPDLSKKMGSVFQVDALLVSTLDFWEYTTLGENKIARIAVAMTLVEADSGAVIWSARHEVQEKYKWFRPELSKVAGKTVGLVIDKMPH